MEANDAALGSGDATTRAQELRASLGARQDVESLLADAGRIRQEAAVAADALVEEAQQLSDQLVSESRSSAEQITVEARERADGVLSRARIEAEEVTGRARATADAIRSKAEADIEEHRRRVRAEVTSQLTRDLTEQHRLAAERDREQSEALISDLEASVRILGVSLESALANVGELMGALEGLRPTAERTAPYAGGHSAAPATSVPSAVSRFGTDQLAPPPAPEPDASSRTAPEPEVDPKVEQEVEQEVERPAAEDAPARPLSATEAFLNSSSLEVEQAAGELRDLQHPEEARRRRSEESRRAAQRRELDEGLSSDDDDPDPGDGARPLGWLFRTAQ